jgi:hypothetical protein
MPGKIKGQINIYFLISVSLFISLSVYLVFLLLNFYPAQGETIRINSLYSKAYTISELMLKDSGYPDDWNPENVERIGLASAPYELNATKINRLSLMCSPFNESAKIRLLNSTGLTDEMLAFTITYLNGTTILSCSPFGEAGINATLAQKRTAQMSRIVSFNRQLAEVTIYVS